VGYVPGRRATAAVASPTPSEDEVTS
jgi:hypothetical protein